jgi:predicted MFS family arabinose efflux permease
MRLGLFLPRVTNGMMAPGDVQIEGRWAVLAILFVARTCIALQFQSVASVGPALVNSLGVEFALLGTLIGLYMLPGIVLALPGGMLMQRLGPLKIALVGLALMSVGAATMVMSSSVVPMGAGRLISGAGGVLLGLALPKMVDDWFVGLEVVTAMSILIASWPLGIAMGLVFFPPLGEAMGWKAVMLSGSVIPLVSLIILALYYRNPPGHVHFKAPSMKINLDRREWLLVSLSGIAYGMFNAAYVAVVSFGPDLLAARGYSPIGASSLISLVGWVLLIALPVGGLIVARSRRPIACIVVGLGVMTAAMLVLPFTAVPAVPLTLIALGCGLTAGTMMALPVQVLRTDTRAVGLGIFYAWYFATMTVLPAAAGLGRDIGHSVAAPILSAAAMTFIALLGIAAFQMARRHPIGSAADQPQ